jgi:hypothetical protein
MAKPACASSRHFLATTFPGPAKPEAARAAIDFRKFPTVGQVRPSNVTWAGVDYAASCTVAEAARFYRQELAKKGWGEQRPTPLEGDDRARLRFRKDAFIVEVSILANEGKGVGIGVHNRGDLYTPDLLHLEDADLNADSVQEATRYTTAATPQAVLDFYRKELPKFGWKLTKGPEAIPSHFELEFIQRDEAGRPGHDERRKKDRSAGRVIGGWRERKD